MYSVAPLHRLIALAAALSSAAAVLAAKEPVTAAMALPGVPADEWLTKLDAKHMMLFDSPEPNDGVGLAHMHDYYEAYNRVYGVPDSAIRGVFTLYGRTTLYAVNDSMWAKYRIGQMLALGDPVTGAPVVTNPWRANPIIRGQSMPGASIEAMQQRGAIFIVCDFALQVFAGMMAQANGLDAVEVYEELKANVLPGAEIVPSVIVAIEQAHRAGLAYQR